MNTAAAAMRHDLGLADNETLWGLCVSIFCAGALLGCSAGAWLANRAGRKRSLLITSGIYAAGAIVEAASGLIGCSRAACGVEQGVLWMLVGRVITGVACGATTVVVPVYLGEIAPPHLRGVLGTLFQLTCVCAMLFAQVAGLPALMGRSTLCEAAQPRMPQQPLHPL